MKRKSLTSLLILALVILVLALHPLFGQAQAQINEPDIPGDPFVSELGDKVSVSRLDVPFPRRHPAQVGEEIRHLLQQLDSSSVGIAASTPMPTVEAPTPPQFELDSVGDTVPGASSQASVASATIDNGDTITALIDTEIIQGYPAANCGSGLLMRAGYDTYLDPDGEIVRSLIQFNLTRIAPQATVYSATLRLYLFSSYDYPGYSIPISPYRIPPPWAVDNVTWNSQPSYAESYPATWITHMDWGWHSFDVTDLVRSWVAGTYPNHGLMLRGPEASVGWRAFTTVETIHPPHLVVEYEQAPDYALTIVPDSQAVSTGRSSLSILYLTATDGFSDSVALAVGGLPANTSYVWSANPVTPTTSTILTITTTPDTPTGLHTFTVTGTSGPIVHSAQAALDVSTSIYLPVVLRNHSTTNVISSHRPADKREIVQASASTATSAVSRIALVIGVADYEHMEPITGTRAGAPGYDPAYTAHDAVKLSGVLRTRGGICTSATTLESQTSECDCYTLLLDSQATKAAIHAAIVNWMDPLEDENTVVVIFFSGHGMYAPDEDGDEADSYDEFIVPHEIDWDPVEMRWLHAMAVSDDELKSWLNVLESRHIAILVDSCFSGGMIETSVGGTRGLAWQPASHGEVTAVQWRDGFTRDIQGPGRVVLTASAEDQPSWEFGALQDGAFTYYLIEALSSASADTNHNGWVSAEEAFTYLENRVDSYVYDHTSDVDGGPYHQNPQISDGVSGEVDLAQLGETIQACPSWD